MRISGRIECHAQEMASAKALGPGSVWQVCYSTLANVVQLGEREESEEIESEVAGTSCKGPERP